MRHACSRSLLITALLLMCSLPVFADEPPKAEPLPSPRIIEPAPPLVLSPPPLVPLGRDIWQLYAVDRSGRFRPRVAYTPFASFYLYNHAPFPWTTTRPLEWMPYASD